MKELQGVNVVSLLDMDVELLHHLKILLIINTDSQGPVQGQQGKDKS